MQNLISKHTRSILLTLAILAAAIFFRSYLPEADVAFDLDFSQGTNTDWPWYLNTALSHVGATNLDPGLGITYDRPLITAYGTLFFKVFGHTLKQMTLLNLFPGLLVVILLGALLRKVANDQYALAVMWLASCNFILIMFSRSPLIYIWMCVIELFAIFLWQIQFKSKPLHNLPKIIAVLFVIALIPAYKLMIVFFIPCLLFSQGLRTSWKKHAQSIILTLISILFLSLIYRSTTLFIYQTIINSIETYLYSPLGICQELWRFWRINTTFFYTKMPLECILAYLACYAIAWTHLQKKKLAVCDYYMAIIFVVGSLTIIPFGYSPLRYFLFLIPPTLYLAVRSPLLMKEAWLTKQATNTSGRFVICSILWVCPLINLLIQIPLRDKFPLEKANMYIFETISLSILFGCIIFYLLRWLYPIPPFSKASKTLLPIVFILLMSFSALFRFGLWAAESTHTLRESMEDLEEIIPADSVLVGPYANLLSLNSTIKSYLTPLDAKLPSAYIQALQNVKASHLVIDTFNSFPKYKIFLEANPDCILLDQFYIRGFEVNLYRLPEVLHAQKPSLFEHAVLSFEAQDLEMARQEWNESQRLHPHSASSTRKLLQLDYQSNRSQAERDELLYEAIARNPDHPMPWLFKLREAKLKNQATEAYDAAQRVHQLTSFLP